MIKIDSNFLSDLEYYHSELNLTASLWETVNLTFTHKMSKQTHRRLVIPTVKFNGRTEHSLQNLGDGFIPDAA